MSLGVDDCGLYNTVVQADMPTPDHHGRPPIGGEWIHEIKHDGYRMMVRRDVSGIRLLTRNGKDWTERLPNDRGSRRSCRSA